MEKTKKRYINVVLIILFLILGSLNTYAIYSNWYSKFPNINAILSAKIVIQNNILPVSGVFLVVSWIVILIILIFLLLPKKIKKIEESYIKKEGHEKVNTDLDTLYSMILKNKKMKLEQISKTFKIDNERALEWIKILENNNLVTIEYPAFNSPLVLIKEKNEEA